MKVLQALVVATFTGLAMVAVDSQAAPGGKPGYSGGGSRHSGGGYGGGRGSGGGGYNGGGRQNGGGYNGGGRHYGSGYSGGGRHQGGGYNGGGRHYSGASYSGGGRYYGGGRHYSGSRYYGGRYYGARYYRPYWGFYAAAPIFWGSYYYGYPGYYGWSGYPYAYGFSGGYPYSSYQDGVADGYARAQSEAPPEPTTEVTPGQPGTPTQRPLYQNFCESAQAYYPKVTSCPEGWQMRRPTYD